MEDEIECPECSHTFKISEARPEPSRWELERRIHELRTTTKASLSQIELRCLFLERKLKLEGIE